jgi:hypothetical protein
MSKTKVFCIGFHKTGTKTLRSALKILGYRVTGPNGVMNKNIARDVHSMTDRLVEKYDAFQDNPWPILYRELDRKYPGSKFILTLRPSDKWISSIVKHFGKWKTPMRKWIYGVAAPAGNESIYVRRYEKHNKEVPEYFKDRPEDLLVFKMSEGDGWEQLCPFLGHPIPNKTFPHVNKADSRERLIRIIKFAAVIALFVSLVILAGWLKGGY